MVTSSLINKMTSNNFKSHRIYSTLPRIDTHQTSKLPSLLWEDKINKIHNKKPMILIHKCIKVTIFLTLLGKIFRVYKLNSKNYRSLRRF